MANVEAVFFWISVWLYGISFISILFGVVFKKDKWPGYGLYMVLAGLLFQTISLGIRWSLTGHPPVKGTYENSMLGSWFMTALFLGVSFRNKKVEVAGIAVVPIILMTMGNGVMTNPALEPLTPPFKSNWLWLHVFFAMMAYGTFCLSAGIGILYLIKDFGESRGREGGIYARLPETPILNDLILRVAMFGFIALTVEIGAGAIWAYGLWGRYWGWDPIENWSLITWLVYGTYLHLGMTLGWKGRRMAWLAILALIFVFITYGGVGYFGGVHTVVL